MASGAPMSKLGNVILTHSLLSAVVLLGVTAQVACAAPPTLCKQGETTYFSCRLKESRVVPVCGSGAVDASENPVHRASWLRYRIGTPKVLELVFPKRKENSVSKFAVYRVREVACVLTPSISRSAMSHIQ